MKTQDEINKAAEKEYPNDFDPFECCKQIGFTAGATFANGYSEEWICNFHDWVRSNCVPSTLNKFTYYYSKTGQYHSIQDLLKLYNERK